MTNEELLKPSQGRIADETRAKEGAKQELELPRARPGKGLEELSGLSKLMKKFQSVGPNSERFSVIEGNVLSALSAYKQIHDERKKQTK